MGTALDEVTQFLTEWPSIEAMCQAMERRFTPTTEWENVGMAKTVGPAQARAFMEGFAKMLPIERGEVILHNAAEAGNIVLTERTDNFYHRDGHLLVSLRLMGVFEMDGPRILAWRDYFDTRPFPSSGESNSSSCFIAA